MDGRNEKGQWVKGASGNPNGRKPGNRIEKAQAERDVAIAQKEAEKGITLERRYIDIAWDDPATMRHLEDTRYPKAELKQGGHSDEWYEKFAELVEKEIDERTCPEPAEDLTDN